MKKLCILMALILAGCNATNQPAQRNITETDLSPVQEVTIETAQKRAKEIFAKDVYAAKATDFLLEQGLLNKQSGVSGWITQIENDLPKTYFIGSSANGYKVIFEVHFPDGNAPELVTPSKITARLANKFQARQQALKSIKSPCSNNYNSVIIEDDDKVIIYALAATTERDKMVVGGHYRFTYTKDATKLLSKERLSNSCLVLEKREDSTPFFTHILTDSPLEVHSYLSKLHGEFYISTRSGLYKANNGEFTLIKDNKK